MEQLLNLLWLMLVLPAALIWWRERGFAQNSRHLCPFSPSLVLLVCLLALLFPVISATDDMQAMRGEVEESSPSKHIVKQSASVRSTMWVNDGGSSARPIQAVSFQTDCEPCGKISQYLRVRVRQSPVNTIGCRAPPAS
jgi:hypothetical protein